MSRSLTGIKGTWQKPLILSDNQPKEIKESWGHFSEEVAERWHEHWGMGGEGTEEQRNWSRHMAESVLERTIIAFRDGKELECPLKVMERGQRFLRRGSLELCRADWIEDGAFRLGPFP